MKTKKILQICAIAGAICVSQNYTNVFSQQPTTHYPQVNGTSLLNQNDVLEITGKLKVLNLSGPQLQADKMVTVGPDGRLKERPIPPLITNPNGPPIGPLSLWHLVSTGAIRTDNKVGIKRDPAFELDVAGDIRASGKVNTTNIHVFDTLIVGTPNHIQMYGNTLHTTHGNLLIQPESNDNNTVFNVNNTNGVGIGIVPQERLHLHLPGSSNVFAYFTNTHTQTTGSGQGFRIGIGQFGTAEIRQYHDSPIQFFTNDAITGAQTERMRIENATGNVGIGETSPAAKLHVSNGIAPLISLERTFGGNQVNTLEVLITSNPAGGGNVNAINASSVTFRMLNPNNLGDMAFMTNPQNIRMIIKNNGNVGIGDFKGSLIPTERLDVSGTLNVSDNIVSNDDGVIRFGNNKIQIDYQLKQITWDAFPAFPPIKTDILGLRIGNGLGRSFGQHSIAIGFDVGTFSLAEKAIVIGSGTTGSLLTNNDANSLWIGFNSDIPTLVVGPSSGAGTTGVVRIGTETITSGTPNDDYKLSVDGKIVARKLISTEVNWGDDEFNKKLSLADLEQEESYVDKHSHLRGIPSDEEVKKNGIDHAKMSELKIRKIEQIFMYLFNFNRIFNELKAKINVLRDENKNLRKANENLINENRQIKKDIMDLKNRVDALEKNNNMK